jgi:hypothetical protein
MDRGGGEGLALKTIAGATLKYRFSNFYKAEPVDLMEQKTKTNEK